MISIMLDIQSDKCLCNTKSNCQKYSTLVPIVVVKESCGGGKVVLHKEEESNVAECTEEVSGCSKLTTSANNLEYFPFDFTLELGIEFVSIDVHITCEEHNDVSICKEKCNIFPKSLAPNILSILTRLHNPQPFQPSSFSPSAYQYGKDESSYTAQSHHSHQRT